MRALLRRLLTHIVTPDSGLDLIADERERQLAVEGFNDLHDDLHTDGALAMAAACFAAPDWIYRFKGDKLNDAWPRSWHRCWDKRLAPRMPTPWSGGAVEARITELAKAGALIAAEIDRLQRTRDRRRSMTPTERTSEVEALHEQLTFAGAGA